MARGLPHSEVRGPAELRILARPQKQSTERKGHSKQCCHICQLPDKKQRVGSDLITRGGFNKEAIYKDVGSLRETTRQKSGKSHSRDPFPPQGPKPAKEGGLWGDMVF